MKARTSTDISEVLAEAASNPERLARIREMSAPRDEAAEEARRRWKERKRAARCAKVSSDVAELLAGVERRAHR